MALFGLGSFAEGFVGGFAESANKALLEDMQAVRDRVKTVSDYRVKRAMDEQEERKEELDEITDALKEGASVFGDDPRATEYAASLLKDQGSITAYKSFIAELRKKKNDSSIDPAGFFARAEADAPTSKGFTVSDYAKAYQGAEKTLPNYRLPEDAVASTAGGLLSKIGFTPDISGRVQERTQEQMAAAGIGVDTVDTSISLPSLDFDSEAWTLSDKDASQKIKYFQEKLVNPRLDEETRNKYENKLQAQLNIAAESKDDDIRLSALEQQFERAKIADRPALNEQIMEIKLRKKRREAQASVDDGSDVMAVKKLDRAAAYIRSQDENLSKEDRDTALEAYYQLGEEINDFGKGEPTVEAKYNKRLENHRRRQVEDPTYKAGNVEFDAEVAELDRLKAISQDGGTKDATTTGITSSVKAIDLIISTNPSVTANIPNNVDFQRIKKVVIGGDTVSEGLAMLNEEERKIYDEGMAAMRGAGQPIVDSYIATLPEGADKSSAIAAAKLLGYDVSKYSAPTATESATPVSDEGVADTGQVQAPSVSEAQAKQAVPDTTESAQNILNRLMRTGGDINQAIADAEERNYSPEFIAVLKAEADTDTTMTRAAMEPAITDEQLEAETTTAAENDVDAAVKIIDTVSGFASKEIRAIAKQLGISKEAATKLHAEAEAAIAARRNENKPTRKRSNRNKGGLMSSNTEQG